MVNNFRKESKSQKPPQWQNYIKHADRLLLFFVKREMDMQHNRKEQSKEEHKININFIPLFCDLMVLELLVHSVATVLISNNGNLH